MERKCGEVVLDHNGNTGMLTRCSLIRERPRRCRGGSTVVSAGGDGVSAGGRMTPLNVMKYQTLRFFSLPPNIRRVREVTLGVGAVMMSCSLNQLLSGKLQTRLDFGGSRPLCVDKSSQTGTIYAGNSVTLSSCTFLTHTHTNTTHENTLQAFPFTHVGKLCS